MLSLDTLTDWRAIQSFHYHNDDVIRYGTLSRIHSGLYFQRRLKCLGCSDCEVLICGEGAAFSHVKVSHGVGKSLLEKTLKTEMAKLYKKLKVRDMLPSVEELGLCNGNSVIDPIGGLRVYTGAFPCMVEGCPKIFTNFRSLTNHYNDWHKDVQRVLGAKDWPAVHAQRIAKAHGFNSLVRVNPPPPPPLARGSSVPDFQSSLSSSQPLPSGARSWLAGMRAEVGELVGERSHETTEARDMSAWIAKTRWHKHIANQDDGFLCSLVAMPRKDEFPGLLSVTRKIFKDAMDVIPATPHLILQKLCTKDPVKG